MNRPARTTAAPSQPSAGSRSPTTSTARTAATTVSSKEMLVAVLALIRASPQPNRT